MMTNKLRVRRLAWVVAASLVALLLTIVVLLSLSQYQAMAKPALRTEALELSKEVNATSAVPGDTLAYTITVYNDNPAFVDVLLTDTLPAELALVPGSLQVDFGSAPQFADGVITWSDNMGPDVASVLSFRAVITTEIIYASVVNTARLTGTGELIEASATTAAFVAMGDLDNETTMKVASAAQVAPGDQLTYTIEIKNSTAETVHDASFTDTLPAGLTYVGGSLSAVIGQVGHASGVITWEATLEGFWKETVQFAVVVSPGVPDGWITNTVEIASPIQAFTREAGVYVKRPRGILEAVKTVDPSGAVHASEELSYTIVISNSGDLTVDAADMSDPLHPDLDYVVGSVSYSSGSAGEAGGTVSWAGPLAPAQQVEIRFAAKMASSVQNGDAIVNTAEITGAGTLVTAEVGVTAVTTYTYWFPVLLRDYPPSMILNPIPAQDGDFKFTVTWPSPGYALDNYTLQMARDESFTDLRNTWTPTGLSQVAYAYCPFYFRVRAENPGEWGHGAWSNIEQAQAAAPTPTLNPIPDPVGGQFTVSWSAIPSLEGWNNVDHYVLQESADQNFGTVSHEWQTGGTSKVVTEPAEGTWYYRVRADDADCWGDGPWSNVESMSNVDVYFDDFSDRASGWPIRKGKAPEINSWWRTHYETYNDLDYYRISIDQGGPQIWFHQPDALAPYVVQTDKYCVETKMRMFKMRPPYDNEGWNYYPYWANGGVVFGANEENTHLYALCTSTGPEQLFPNMLGWFVVRNTEYVFPKKGCNYQPGIKPGEDAGALRVNQWHRFQVSVDGNSATIIINGVVKGTYNLPGLSNTTRVGLIGGDYEVTPVDYWFDWFRVIPDEACVPFGTATDDVLRNLFPQGVDENVVGQVQ